MRISLTLALALAIFALPSDAAACGGCFAPVGSVSVVNAHRMALLSAPTGSVLWDQIQYTGSPEDFVWVLPVAGTPTVEVADNGFFEALNQTTTIQMVAPRPPQTFCPGSYCYRAAAAADAGASRSDASIPVNVYHEGVVGPYETATIGSSDSTALVTWLRDHGYEVSADLMPTIDYYVGLHMNFIALRLAPTAGIDRMTPVRVAMPGLALTLPLRMIAAGVTDEVSLELFVFSEARMEAANFGNAEVDRSAVTFDWSSRTFDYDARFDDALFSGTGVLNNWVTEYAQLAQLYYLASYTSGYGADVHSARADVQIVSDALPQAYLTRLRTRLPPSQLGTDLTLRLSNGAPIAASFNVMRELHRQPDVVCPAMPTCPTDGPGAAGGGCAVHGRGAGAPWAIAAMMIGLALARRSRS